MQLMWKKDWLTVSITGIGGGFSPVSGFFQSEYINPNQLPFKFGKGTSHPLNSFSFHPHFTNTATIKRSMLTTFGTSPKKSLTFDKSSPLKYARENQATADIPTSRYSELLIVTLRIIRIQSNSRPL